jgi:hypothetical protein
VDETRHAVPILTRFVRWEIADRREMGSKRGFEKRLSPTQAESNPSPSTTSLRSSNSGMP